MCDDCLNGLMKMDKANSTEILQLYILMLLVETWVKYKKYEYYKNIVDLIDDTRCRLLNY